MAQSSWENPYFQQITITATGVTLLADLRNAGKSRDEFTVQAKGTGAAPTTLTAALEGSIDGANWTSLQAIAQTDDGVLKFVAQKLVTMYRINVTALTLGGASNVVFSVIAA